MALRIGVLDDRAEGLPVRLVLALALLLLLMYLANRGWRAWRQKVQRRRILRWVEEVEARFDPVAAPQAFLSAMNRIFKLVALKAFPEESCARLQGEDWAVFLQREMADAPDNEQLAILAAGPYQELPRFDPETLSRLARHWILTHG